MYWLVARKGTYRCPSCNLYIRHGDINGTYFSHRQGESCEPFKAVDTDKKSLVFWTSENFF
ncbi:hypothetical protein [Lysinibacillus capsici]|uniref:competence protein CoiA family protein n=1 Tax=Lysinibacillus capsici TaxID=2115968 RepID=UPI003F51B3A3